MLTHTHELAGCGPQVSTHSSASQMLVNSCFIKSLLIKNMALGASPLSMVLSMLVQIVCTCLKVRDR